METAQSNTTSPAEAEKPAAASPAKFETIPLETPVRRGEQTIATVQLRKPQAGEMRGLNLQSIIQGEVNDLLSLLPRITVPPLLPQEVEALDPADLAAMAGGIRGFFMSRAEQEAMAKFFGIEAPETSTA